MYKRQTLTTTAWVALLYGVAFVIRSLRHPQPVMDLRALQDRTFSLGCYFSFMAGVGIFATIYLTPVSYTHLDVYKRQVQHDQSG